MSSLIHKHKPRNNNLTVQAASDWLPFNFKIKLRKRSKNPVALPYFPFQKCCHVLKISVTLTQPCSLFLSMKPTWGVGLKRQPTFFFCRGSSVLCSVLSNLKFHTIFHLTPSVERYPAFSFNIHWLLIIKGMYLNYKYTSYTEVGKAGI